MGCYGAGGVELQDGTRQGRYSMGVSSLYCVVCTSIVYSLHYCSIFQERGSYAATNKIDNWDVGDMYTAQAHFASRFIHE